MFKNTENTLQYYLSSGIIEGVAALAILFLIPSDPKNAWLLGFSKTRLAMAVGLLLVIGGFVFLTARARKDGRFSNFAGRVAKIAGDYPVYVPVMLAAYGLVIFGAYAYLYLTLPTLTTLQGILIRIFPLIFYAMTRILQAGIVWIMLAKHQLQNVEKTEKDSSTLVVNPTKIVTFLTGIAILLILTSVMLDVIEELTWARKFLGFRVKFDLDQEANVPTFFATMILLISSFLLLVIGTRERLAGAKFGLHWQGLALIFFILSIDEASVLHEKLINLFRLWFNPTGIFYFGWVIVALPLLLILGVAYLRFFWHLPTDIRIRITIAGFLYLSGALGMELIGGWFAEKYGENLGMYNVITTIEESLEYIGILTFISVLLTYLSERTKSLHLKISRGRT